MVPAIVKFSQESECVRRYAEHTDKLLQALLASKTPSAFPRHLRNPVYGHIKKKHHA